MLIEGLWGCDGFCSSGQHILFDFLVYHAQFGHKGGLGERNGMRSLILSMFESNGTLTLHDENASATALPYCIEPPKQKRRIDTHGQRQEHCRNHPSLELYHTCHTIQ